MRLIALGTREDLVALRQIQSDKGYHCVRLKRVFQRGYYCNDRLRSPGFEMLSFTRLRLENIN